MEAKESPKKKVDNVKEKTLTGSTIPVFEDNILDSIPAAPTSKDAAHALIGVPQKGKTISKLDARVINIGRKTSSKPGTQEVLDVLTKNEKQVDIVAGIDSQQKPAVSSTASPDPEAKEDTIQTKSTSSDDEDESGNDDDTEDSSEATEDDENPSSSPEKKSVKGKKSACKEVIHIEDSNVTPSRKPRTQVPPVEDAIPGGESFMYAGSVNTTNKSRPQRYQRNEQATEAISELVMMNRISPSSELNKIYTDNVMNSRFKGLRLRKTDDDGGTKVRIGPSEITDREFVQALQPLGKICLNFMWTISNAIRHDWKSHSRVILDQAFIMQLTKPFTECDHASLAKRLSKLNLDEIEQAANLQKAYSKARSGDFPNIIQLPKHYKSAGVQNNNKDCGYWVVRVLQCHNGKDIVGNSKITIELFRKEICYVLLYHAYNDFNPRRENLAALLEAASKASS